MQNYFNHRQFKFPKLLGVPNFLFQPPRLLLTRQEKAFKMLPPVKNLLHQLQMSCHFHQYHHRHHLCNDFQAWITLPTSKTRGWRYQEMAATLLLPIHVRLHGVEATMTWRRFHGMEATMTCLMLNLMKQNLPERHCAGHYQPLWCPATPHRLEWWRMALLGMTFMKLRSEEPQQNVNPILHFHFCDDCIKSAFPWCEWGLGLEFFGISAVWWEALLKKWFCRVQSPGFSA